MLFSGSKGHTSDRVDTSLQTHSQVDAGHYAKFRVDARHSDSPSRALSPGPYLVIGPKWVGRGEAINRALAGTGDGGPCDFQISVHRNLATLDVCAPKTQILQLPPSICLHSKFCPPLIPPPPLVSVIMTAPLGGGLYISSFCGQSCTCKISSRGNLT